MAEQSNSHGGNDINGIHRCGYVNIEQAAMSKGMSGLVLIVYYDALAAIILLPFFLCRRKRAPLTFSLLCNFFLLGLIGCLSQIFVFTGIKYSSPTLTAAISNMLPIFSFFLAIIFRMEKINMRSSAGIAICLSTSISVSGALIVTLYKGPQILLVSSLSDFPHQILGSQQSNWVFGGLLLAFGFLSGAAINILTAIFGGIYRTGIYSWCLKLKGPIYVGAHVQANGNCHCSDHGDPISWGIPSYRAALLEGLR